MKELASALGVEIDEGFFLSKEVVECDNGIIATSKPIKRGCLPRRQGNIEEMLLLLAEEASARTDLLLLGNPWQCEEVLLGQATASRLSSTSSPTPCICCGWHLWRCVVHSACGRGQFSSTSSFSTSRSTITSSYQAPISTKAQSIPRVGEPQPFQPTDSARFSWIPQQEVWRSSCSCISCESETRSQEGFQSQASPVMVSLVSNSTGLGRRCEVQCLHLNNDNSAAYL